MNFVMFGLLCFSCGFINIYGSNDIGTHETRLPIFASDDFPKCKQEGNIFCRVKFCLSTKNNESVVWKSIEKTKHDSRYFSNDVVYRRRCLPNILEGKMDEIIGSITMQENVILTNLSLNAHVDQLHCNNYSAPIEIRSFEYILLYATVLYMGAILLATVIDLVSEKEGQNKNFSTIISALSIHSNWRYIWNPRNKFEIKCLQGLRTMNIALVVIGHTIFTALFADVADHTYIENFYNSTFKKSLLNFGLHIVQINFIMAAMLLAMRLHKYRNSGKRLTLRTLFNMIFLRYLRLLPALAFMILWESSNWTAIMVRPPPAERMDMDYKACQKNWWATLLFVNNLFYSSDMCNLGTWYLADEFQMFIIAITIFYIMDKFNFGEKIILIFMGFFWTVHAWTIYYHNETVIYNFTPENSKVENSVAAPVLYILYTSIYANFGSYAIGLLLGGIYYKYGNQKIIFNKKMTFLWMAIFFGLPLTSVYLSLFDYGRLINGILGASLKPIFSIGIGTGILGMSFGNGGIVKSICEWKFLVFLANWSYCTYIIHFGIVFGRALFWEHLLDISDTMLLNNVIPDLIQSFAAGLILHLLVERPMANIFMLLIRKNVPDVKSE